MRYVLRSIWDSTEPPHAGAMEMPFPGAEISSAFVVEAGVKWRADML